jgi:hypothetical protein
MKNYWNLKLSKIVYLFFAIVPVIAHAQPSARLKDEEKYLYPINPGKPGSLAGNMGELRSTHFHSGIDIRTNNMVGMPVSASKSGYISKVIISTAGYGNVLFVTHADGNSTLYAHLSELRGAVANEVLKQRYAKKTSEIELTFAPGQFPVSQGEIIALSGNSGGSTGPHLHFDIRDSSNNALNPLQFGFNEVSDKFPPTAEKIALQTLDINSRINDRFGRFEFYAQRVGKNYILAQPILAHGNIGIEILAKDKFAAKSAFYGGVNYFEMKVDSQRVFNQAIEKLDVAETRTIYTLTNYKTMRTKGTRFYKLYIDDGNDLKFYEGSPGKGKINVSGKNDMRIQIDMKDSYGNKSNASFWLRPDDIVKEVDTLEPLPPTTDIFFDITENVMMVVAKPCGDSSRIASVFEKGVSSKREPTYYNANRSVYLFDLRKEIPDSVVVCGKSVKPKINAMIPSNTPYKFYNEFMDIDFPAASLYDTLFLDTDHQITKNGTEVFTIGDRINPLNKAIHVSVRPSQLVNWTPSSAIYRLAGRGYTYIGGKHENGKIDFYTREFGDFIVLEDTVPPSIRVMYVNTLVAKFKIKDNLSGISSFEANLNGNWLLLNYDYKTGMIWSEKLDKNQPLRGNLELVVTDNAGNKKIYKQRIP